MCADMVTVALQKMLMVVPEETSENAHQSDDDTDANIASPD